MAKRTNRVSLAGRPFRIETETDVISVVLAQPHRRGNTDQKCASAWGRFVIRNKLAERVYDAGLEYAGVAQRWRKLKGISSATAGNVGAGFGEPSNEEIKALTKRMYDLESVMVRHSMAALLLMRSLLLDDEDVFADTMTKPAAVALAGYLGFLPPVAPFHSAKMAA